MHDVVSVEHLRGYISRDGGTPPSKPSDGPEDPKMVKILGERLWNGKKEVLCLRDNEEESQAVWERIEMIELDRKLLREFRERSKIWIAGEDKEEKDGGQDTSYYDR